jgi:integrase
MSLRKIVSKKSSEVRWEVRAYTDGRGSTRLKRVFDRKVDAEAYQEELNRRKKENERLGPEARAFEDTTFRAEAEYWIENRGVEFSPGHRRRVDGILEEILPVYGELPPNYISPSRLSEFRRKELARGSSPATVNRKTDVFIAVLNHSVGQRRIAFNPANGFKKLKEVREDMRFWERPEAEAFLEFASAKYPLGSEQRWVYVVYLLTINTAMRAGEVWGFQPRDLIQGGELIHVQRQWDLNVKGDIKFRPPKGKKSRRVPCNEVLRGELTELIRSRRTPPERTVFQTRAGTPVSQDNFDDRTFQPDIQESGVKRIRFHDLRHTGTSLMIAQGYDIRTVQEICGHKDISTTMRYVHLLGDSIRKVAQGFSVAPKKTPQLKLVTS